MLENHIKSVLISGILVLVLVGSVVSNSLVGSSYATTIQVCPSQCRPYEYGVVTSGQKPYYYTNTSPRTGIAIAPQTNDVLTGLTIGKDGAMYVTYKVGVGKWNTVGISPKGIFPPGGNIAIAKQTNNMLTALTIGTDGRLYQLWVIGTGEWNKPTDQHIGAERALKDMYGRPVGECSRGIGAYGTCPPYPPAMRGSGSGFLPGAPIAVHKQSNNILAGLTVDNLGALTSFNIEGNEPPSTIGLQLVEYKRLTDIGKFPLGAGVSMAQQANNLLTGLVVGHDGALYVTWSVDGGAWQGPLGISPPKIFPPGAAIATTKQANNLLTALAVGNNGALHVSWVVDTGKWNGPIPISPPNTFSPGAGIAMTNFAGARATEALTVGKDGGLYVSGVVGTGKWNGPVKISQPQPPSQPPGGPPLQPPPEFGK